MAADVRYIGAQVSIFYHNADVHVFDQDQMTDVVLGKYLPPVLFDGPDGYPVRAMISEHGNSQIIVTSSSISLNASFSPRWQQQSELGRQYVGERVGLLFGIVSGLRATALIYAGTTVETRITSTLDDSDIARAIEDVYGGRFGDRLTDLAVKASEVVDGNYNRNVTVHNFRIFAAGPQAPPQIKLENATASERGVGVSVDYNSRYGYNEGRNAPVTPEDVSRIIDGAFSASAEMSRRVAERLT
jgi:hypothetical protein